MNSNTDFQGRSISIIEEDAASSQRIDPSTNSLPRAYEEKNNGRISRRIARREINRNRKSLEWENLSGKFTRNEYNSECRGRISRIKRGEELRNN